MSEAQMMHHGLIEVPLGRKHGIYWLRLYELTNGSQVAVVTEVPGNPAQTVTNAISRIATFIGEIFGADPRELLLFEIWPAGADGRKAASVTRVSVETSPPNWHSSSRREIEQVLGIRLESLPPHDALYAQVLALGGGTRQELVRSVFDAIPVTDLPPPHNLFNCPLYREFQSEQAVADRSIAENDDEEIDMGRSFVASMTVERSRSCPYHLADWQTIANESVRILSRLGQRDADDYTAAALSVRLPNEEKRWLHSLFDDPVDVCGGGYTNGQHRGCALRLSGADRAAVVVDEESLGETSTDWVYLGEG
jgi:hypothetical protein